MGQINLPLALIELNNIVKYLFRLNEIKFWSPKLTLWDIARIKKTINNDKVLLIEKIVLYLKFVKLIINKTRKKKSSEP